MTRTKTVIYARKRTRHSRHLVLTVCTGGGWLLIWAPLAAWRAWGPRHRTTIVTTTR